MAEALRLARGLKPLWLARDRLGLYRIHDGEVFEIDLETWEALAAIHRDADPGEAAAPMRDGARDMGLLVGPEAGYPAFPQLPVQQDSWLRYLNLQITHRCQLRCLHCYHGEELETGRHLDKQIIFRALDDFAALGGLAFTVSGGEPTLHPDFWELNARIPELTLRAELFTNGLGITPERIRQLRFHRLRVSLDGLEAGHERIRGRGTWAPTVRFARAVREAGLELEVSTMLHGANRSELDGLERFVREELAATAWRVGLPFDRGFWVGSRGELALGAAEAASLGKRFQGFGDASFVSDDRPACDAEMLTVDADGSVGSCAMLPETFRWTLQERPLDEVWRTRAGALGGVEVSSLACRARCLDEEASERLAV